MEESKTYSIQEAADKIKVSAATIRRRVLDKTINSVFISRKEGYKITEEDLNKFAETLKTNPYYSEKGNSKRTAASRSAKGKAKGKKKTDKTASDAAKKSDAKVAASVKEAVNETVKPEAKPVKNSAAKSRGKKSAAKVVASNDATTEMLIGGQLGVALSAIMGAYSSIGELTLPEENVKKLIKELNSPVVIDKVIARLKAEQEYYDIQTASLELEAKQAVGKTAKAEAEQKLIEMRLKKNQIGKDITDLEIRKTLLG